MVGLLIAAPAAGEPKVIKSVTVYQTSGRYGGWPANHGIWSWDNEILVGFSAAYFKWLGPDQHPYDRAKPEEPYLGRSLDGGETWSIEPAPSLVPPEGMYIVSGPGGKAEDLASISRHSLSGRGGLYRRAKSPADWRRTAKTEDYPRFVAMQRWSSWMPIQASLSPRYRSAPFPMEPPAILPEMGRPSHPGHDRHGRSYSRDVVSTSTYARFIRVVTAGKSLFFRVSVRGDTNGGMPPVRAIPAMSTAA